LRPGDSAADHPDPPAHLPADAQAAEVDGGDAGDPAEAEEAAGKVQERPGNAAGEDIGALPRGRREPARRVPAHADPVPDPDCAVPGDHAVAGGVAVA